jgi:hypothetical protein
MTPAEFIAWRDEVFTNWSAKDGISAVRPGGSQREDGQVLAEGAEDGGGGTGPQAPFVGQGILFA